MSNHYRENAAVKWKWGTGYGHGVVQSRFDEKVARKIGGKEITRNGDADNPAYYVRCEEGENVLKLGSELEADG